MKRGMGNGWKRCESTHTHTHTQGNLINEKETSIKNALLNIQIKDR